MIYPYPSWPKKRVLLAVSAVGGIVFGLIIVVLQIILRDGATNRQDIERHVGLPCNTTIPLIKTNLATYLKINGKDVNYKISNSLVFSVNHKETRFGQAFRLIAHKLRENAHSNNVVIAVISPGIRDGKTVLASNLAFTLADQGEKVLLLDLNFGEHPFKKAVSNDIENCKQTNEIDQFTKLGNGSCEIYFHSWPKNQPFEKLLPVDDIQNFLARMREQFSFIILDTAPWTQNTDTIAVVQRSDVAMLIISKTRTPLRDVRSMISQGELSEKTQLDLVMNRSSSSLWI